MVLLGMSMDADTALAAWAKESRYPGVFVSDSTLAVARLYGSVRTTNAGGQTGTRNLFVIAPDGRITYRATPFNLTAQDAYTELGKAVDRAAGVSTPP